MNIAVLASTRGTDLQAIIDEIKDGKMEGINLTVVISDKEDCLALKRAKDQNFPAVFIDPKVFPSQIKYDREILKVLREYNVDLVVLVGYMRILGDEIIDRYRHKILNVHPSLIPLFSGPGMMDKNVYEEVLKSGMKITGCTIHFVTEEVDQGPIVLQKAVEIDNDETSDSLKEKVQGLEKKWYPEVIRWIAAGKVWVEESRVRIMN